MERWYLPKAFIIPPDYIIPEGEALLTDVNYPETNSKSYQYKVSQYQRPTDYPPFYSSITQNEDGLFILSANNLNTNVFDGVIGATYNFDSFHESGGFNEAVFKIYLKDNTFNLQFLEDSLFIGTTANNALNLYTAKAPLREGKIMGEIARDFTNGAVKCLTQLQDDHRFVVGTTKGSIEGFDYSISDIQSMFSFANAHPTEVKGISSHPSLQSQWISCSSFGAYFWDKRKVHASRALLTKNSILSDLTDIKWYADQYIAVTDSSGEYMVFDCRKSNDVIFQMSVHPDIERLVMNGDMLAIISKTKCKIRFYKIDKTQEPKLLHEHTSSLPIYSMCWDVTGKKEFPTCYIVGYRFAETIVIKNK